ncbi:DUF423 domain-containing protein [Legionella lytica]|uniref:DUF423 domain-containing protein n=1 Tax=Legionella lytica TaxID=96232 RepID=A0ABW8D8P6_9GAMM
MNSISETETAKRFITAGALFALLATVLGAFATHGLQGTFSVEQMKVFQTGIFYQFVHSLSLIMLGLLVLHANFKLIRWAGYLFIAGILFFSGSLYLLCIVKIKPLGIITPIGGMCFIMGWLSLAIGIYRKN